MSQERQTNPLPKGRYWLIVSGAENLADFGAWLLDMRNAVKVEESELDPDTGHEFVIFRVITDAAFLNAEQFGFPNRAPSSVKHEADVEQVPDVDVPDAGDLLSFLKTAGIVAAGLFTAKLVVDLFKKG